VVGYEALILELQGTCSTTVLPEHEQFL
jgi:hypothetical protein